jgi:L-threonylcarbamoyladenylate synthase
VAFPTETVYGLGADAMNESAVRKIFEAKGRPADNPLIVHVGGPGDVERVAEGVSADAFRLIERFWPGPLTLVLKRKAEVPAIVSAGLPTIAVRMPASAIALELIRRAGTPIAAPSANRSGRPSPTSAAHVLEDLGGRIDMIIDGGQTQVGIESTVLDMSGGTPTILRPGWVTREQIAEVTGPVLEPASEADLRRSPGTRYRHYSPRARVLLVTGGTPALLERICRRGLKTFPVGLISHTRIEIDDPNFHAIHLEKSAGDYARSIYGALRELEGEGAGEIVVEGIDETGEGAAVMERLRRAASEVINEK